MGQAFTLDDGTILRHVPQARPAEPAPERFTLGDGSVLRHVPRAEAPPTPPSPTSSPTPSPTKVPVELPEPSARFAARAPTASQAIEPDPIGFKEQLARGITESSGVDMATVGDFGRELLGPSASRQRMALADAKRFGNVDTGLHELRKAKRGPEGNVELLVYGPSGIGNLKRIARRLDLTVSDDMFTPFEIPKSKIDAMSDDELGELQDQRESVLQEIQGIARNRAETALRFEDEKERRGQTFAAKTAEVLVDMFPYMQNIALGALAPLPFGLGFIGPETLVKRSELSAPEVALDELGQVRQVREGLQGSELALKAMAAAATEFAVETVAGPITGKVLGKGKHLVPSKWRSAIAAKTVEKIPGKVRGLGKIPQFIPGVHGAPTEVYEEYVEGVIKSGFNLDNEFEQAGVANIPVALGALNKTFPEMALSMVIMSGTSKTLGVGNYLAQQRKWKPKEIRAALVAMGKTPSERYEENLDGLAEAWHVEVEGEETDAVADRIWEKIQTFGDPLNQRGLEVFGRLADAAKRKIPPEPESPEAPITPVTPVAPSAPPGVSAPAVTPEVTPEAPVDMLTGEIIAPTTEEAPAPEQAIEAEEQRPANIQQRAKIAKRQRARDRKIEKLDVQEGETLDEALLGLQLDVIVGGFAPPAGLKPGDFVSGARSWIEAGFGSAVRRSARTTYDQVLQDAEDRAIIPSADVGPEVLGELMTRRPVLQTGPSAQDVERFEAEDAAELARGREEAIPEPTEPTAEDLAALRGEEEAVRAETQRAVEGEAEAPIAPETAPGPEPIPAVIAPTAERALSPEAQHVLNNFAGDAEAAIRGLEARHAQQEQDEGRKVGRTELDKVINELQGNRAFDETVGLPGMEMSAFQEQGDIEGPAFSTRAPGAAPTGVTVEAAEARVAPLRAKWKGGPKTFTVVADINDPRVPDVVRRKAQPGARGVYDPATDSVFLFADQITDKPGEDAPFVAVHEVVVERGVPAVLGPRGANEFYSRLSKSRAREIKKYAKGAGIPFTSTQQRRDAAREWFADRTAANDTSTGFRKVWDQLRELFAKALRKLTGRAWQDAEIDAVIRAAHGHAERAPAAEGIGAPALAPAFSTVPGAQDRAYLAAVEAGDTETAQRMVDDAAEAAGYDGPWFHTGSFNVDEGDTRFSTEPFGVHFGTEGAALERTGSKILDDFWEDFVVEFDEDQGGYYWESQGMESGDVFETEAEAEDDANEAAQSLADNTPETGFVTTNVFLRRGNSLRLPDLMTWDAENVAKTMDNKGVPVAATSDAEVWFVVTNGVPTVLEYSSKTEAQDAIEQMLAEDRGRDRASLRAEKGVSKKRTHHDIVKALRAAGYDSIIYKNQVEEKGSDSVIVFSPTDIKSAEPFTEDDAGKVIPLSQRFQADEPDIRFSTRPGGALTPSESPAEVQARKSLGLRVKGAKSLGLRIGRGRFPVSGLLGEGEETQIVVRDAGPEFTDALAELGFTEEDDASSTTGTAWHLSETPVAGELVPSRTGVDALRTERDVIGALMRAKATAEVTALHPPGFEAEKGVAESAKIQEKLFKLGFTDHMSHETKVIGLTGEDGAGHEALFGALIDSEDAETSHRNHAQDFAKQLLVDEALDEKTGRQWSRTLAGDVGLKRGEKRIEPVDVPLAEGKTISMSRADLGDLVNTLGDSKTRELLQGGVPIVFEANPTKKPTVLTEADMLAIEAFAADTPEGRVAAGLQGYTTGPMADLVTPVFARREGRDLPTRPDYWPRRRKEIDPEPGKALDMWKDRYAEDIAQLKPRSLSLQDPIVIGDMFKTFQNHVSHATAYAAKSEAVDNALRVVRSDEFSRAVVEGKKHGTELLKDLEDTILEFGAGQNVRASDLEKWVRKMLKRAHIGALGLKPHIVAYQVVSMIGATAEIEAKYLFHPSVQSPSGNAQARQEIRDNAPLLRARIEGDVHNILTPGASGESARGFYFGRQTGVAEASVRGIHASDTQVMLRIWKAAQRKGAAQGLSGQALMDFTRDEAYKIVNRTQPSWNILTTSTWHKVAQRNPLAKPLIMYSSQRIKNFNMVVRAHIRLQQSEKTKADYARFLRDITIPTLVNSAAIHFIRKGTWALLGVPAAFVLGDIGDDDEGFGEDVAAIAEKLLGNWLVFGDTFGAFALRYLMSDRPFFEQEPSNILVDAMSDAIKGGIDLPKSVATRFAGDKLTTQEKKRADNKAARAAKQALKATGMLTGVPIPGFIQVWDKLTGARQRAAIPKKRRSATTDSGMGGASMGGASMGSASMGGAKL